MRRRNEGGDRVEATVVHEVAYSEKLEVLDNENGTYTMSFKVMAEGKWTLRTKVCAERAGLSQT